MRVSRTISICKSPPHGFDPMQRRRFIFDRLADDIQQATRHEDDLLHLRVADELLDRLVLQQLLAVVLAQRGGHHDAAAHLALDLHGDFHLVRDELVFVVGRPALRIDRLAEAADLPHFLRHVRGNRVQAQQQGAQFAARHAAAGVDFVDVGHHRRDGGVVLHALVILGDLLNHRVDRGLHLVAHALLVRQDILQAPDALDEAAAAARALGRPRNRLIERAHEHLIHTEPAWRPDPA